MLPATFIDCVNMKEAAELVLALPLCQNNTARIIDFVQNFDLDFPDLKI
jgi:hypothetical protein